jgi:hypothetical protein
MTEEDPADNVQIELRHFYFLTTTVLCCFHDATRIEVKKGG